MYGEATPLNVDCWTLFGLTLILAIQRASCAVSTSATRSHITAIVPIWPLIGFTRSPDCALHAFETVNGSPYTNPPDAGGVRDVGAKSADALSALSARASAAAFGEPALVSVGLAPFWRAIA